MHTSPQTVVPATFTPLANFSWDTNPETRILMATYCCPSPITQELVRFYVPEAQIWGDGRFLWTEKDEQGARQVFISQIETEEIQALIQELNHSGFFDWQEEYIGEPVVDGMGKCLTVTLVDRQKTVCESHGGAPPAFYTLFDRLSNGVGLKREIFQPEKIYVSGFRLVDQGALSFRPDLTWEETQIQHSISQALNGLLLEEAQARKVLWDAANQDPYHMPLVEDRGALYRLIIQVPGVSWIEP